MRNGQTASAPKNNAIEVQICTCSEDMLSDLIVSVVAVKAMNINCSYSIN